MNQLITIDRSELQPAINRWLHLTDAQRQKLMRDNEYVCLVKLSEDEQFARVAEVHFGNPEGSYRCIHVLMPVERRPASAAYSSQSHICVQTIWEYHYRDKAWSKREIRWWSASEE